MIYVTKTKEKSPLSSQIVNVWHLSTKVNDKVIKHSYYGYARCEAVNEFKKLIKN